MYHTKEQGQPNLLCGAWNLAKFGLHVDNMKFNTQNKELGNKHVIICTILPACSAIHHVQYKYVDKY